MNVIKISPSEIQSQLDHILPRVSKPGRYTGGELNSMRKNWDEAQVRLALAFPEVYDLGMSNLGLMILYELVNRIPDMLAERVFCPWTDMEAAMRQAELPLHTLEGKHPVSSFDVLGISLPYEQLYTNALNLLDLSGIPILSRERDERHPLVIAGGHATFNPEPMSPFIDAFAIGDGEELLIDILEVVRQAKQQGLARSTRLHHLSRIPGVYVPSYYSASYHDDGTLAALRPLEEDAPERILKRIVAALPAPPTQPVVPYIKTTHNRAMIEIMRGCTRGCRFCQAGFVTRPVRERPLEEVLDAVGELISNTGYEELSLLSLSSSDYTNIVGLADAIVERFRGRHLSISLPSLRIETSSADLLEAVGIGRKGSATLAPEAATDRMRSVINKMIPEEQILTVTEDLFSRGWRTIKLYFMIGHPTETLDDVRAIARLSQAILQQGRKHHGRKARVNLGVSTFIPKPHTPFQWTALDQPDHVKAKLDLLKETARGRGLELKWNDPQETLFEGLLSRGDRRLAEVVHRAWQLGARFDGWQEHFDLEVWQQALDDKNLSWDFYTHRPRPLDELLPWDHIDTGVRKEYLIQEYYRSQREETRDDCRNACVACGILTAYRQERQKPAAASWQCP